MDYTEWPARWAHYESFLSPILAAREAYKLERSPEGLTKARSLSWRQRADVLQPHRLNGWGPRKHDWPV